MEIYKKIENARREVVFLGISNLFQNPSIWEQFRKTIFPELEASDVKVEVIGESDNQLFQLSLHLDDKSTLEDQRTSFTELKLRRELVQREITKNSQRSAKWKFGICSTFMPISVVKIDDEIFMSPFANPSVGYSQHKLVENTEPWFTQIKSQLQELRDPLRLGKFIASPDQEMLELFDKDRIPRGIFPRSSFYDSDHAQFVVWAFVFDRDGRMLIHQRSETAKDNQGMWDKSVGGHVDFTLERSSNYAAVRELIEELFTDEGDKTETNQPYSALQFLKPSFDSAKYLGDWAPESLGTDYLSQISLIEEAYPSGDEPWFYYQVANNLQVNSPRKIPSGKGGGERRLKVIADVFLFLANSRLDQKALRSLKNSPYMLCYPSELRTWLENKERDGEFFEGAPDLNYVMTGKLRDTLEEFSQLAKYSDIRKLK